MRFSILRNHVYRDKVRRILRAKIEAGLGRAFGNLEATLSSLELRPFELHLELTNVCNANCVFCSYQFQTRPHRLMSDDVFFRAVGQYIEMNGGSVGLTPIVGDALLDPKFLARVKYLRELPAIDRIWVITNGIALDRYSSEEILESGLSSIYISTAGFNKRNYDQVYRSTVRDAYERMRDSVTALVRENAARGKPVTITIGFRTDRKLEDVLEDDDFQVIREHEPLIDFLWWYRQGGGRISAETLLEGMRVKPMPAKKEPCSELYRGPIVLPDGIVLACTCIGAMDAVDDLRIGHIEEGSLLEIWQGESIRRIRSGFGSEQLNGTCQQCSSYTNLDRYRTRDGRQISKLNQLRHEGQPASRGVSRGFFEGG